MTPRATKDPLPLRLTLSALAAACSETATFPLDLIKTRLQLHRGQPRSVWTELRSILASDSGVRGLYSGLAPAVLRHVPYTSLRVVIFESLKNWNWNFGAAAQRDASSSQKVAFPSLLLFGFIAGGTGQLAAVPADLVKIRMQADSTRYASLIDAFRDILKKEGWKGMWRGSSPAVQRAAIVNLGELSTYDASKRAVLNSGVVKSDGPIAHTLAAICSGFVSSLLSSPADVVKSRMMAQDPLNPTYKGTWDCFIKTRRAEGIRGLYKGFLPCWARLGPWQLVFWLSFEQLRKVAGMGGF